MMRYLFFALVFCFALEGSVKKAALCLYVSGPSQPNPYPKLKKALSEEKIVLFNHYCLDSISEELSLLEKEFALFICPSTPSDVAWAQKKWKGLPILPQVESNNLGIKIEATVKAVQKRGFEEVLVLTTNSPTLPLDYIRQCKEQLLSSDIVLGPTLDGEVYLLATKTPLPDLGAIRWGTTFALEDCTKTLTAEGQSVGIGLKWYKVHTLEELWMLEKDLRQEKGKNGKLLSFLECLKKVTIIIPVRNEKNLIARQVLALNQLVPKPEILFVDGGSEDGSLKEIEKAGLHPLVAEEISRGDLLNRGIEKAEGSVLLFLHPDTLLNQKAYSAMLERLEDPAIVGGAFSYAISGSGSNRFRNRVIESWTRVRNNVFHMPYGKQAYFIKKTALAKVGPFSSLPLMEDIEWFERLKKTNSYVILEEPVKASSKEIDKSKWISENISTISLLALYKLGVPPKTLLSFYQKEKK